MDTVAVTNSVVGILMVTIKNMRLALLALLSLAYSGFAAAAVADIDPSFGNNGVTILSPSPQNLDPTPNNLPQPVALAHDGSDRLYLLVDAPTTQTSPTAPPTETYWVYRFTSNGVLDPSFGDNGRLMLLPSVRTYRGLAVDDSRSSLLLVGDDPGPFVTRIEFSGIADPTFNGSGYASSVPTTTSAVSVLTGGLIVVAGTADSGSDVFIARLSASGDLDTSFGDGGAQVLALPSPSGIGAVAVVQDANGRMLVGGPQYGAPFVARFSASGQADPSFGAGGILQLTVNATGDLRAINARSGGGFDLLGMIEGSDASNTNVRVARFDATGAPDPSYGSSGVEQGSYVSQSLAYNPPPLAIVQSDGKIVVATNTSAQGNLGAISLTRLMGSTELQASSRSGGGNSGGGALSPISLMVFAGFTVLRRTRRAG